MSLESKIVELTEQIVRLSNVIAASGITAPTGAAANVEQFSKAAEVPKVTEAQKKAAAKKKAKAEADAAIAKVAGRKTPAQVKKAERDAARQAEIDAETAAAKEAETAAAKEAEETVDDVEVDLTGEPEGNATEADCRTVATYIMKVVKDKAGLSGVLKGHKTNNLSNFKGDYNVFLADLEKVAGKSLAEIA